jgi:hypothetical protein
MLRNSCGILVRRVDIVTDVNGYYYLTLNGLFPLGPTRAR